MTPQEPIHVSLNISNVSKTLVVREGSQGSIKVIVVNKMSFEDAKRLLLILAEQIAIWEDGMGPITYSSEADVAT